MVGTLRVHALDLKTSTERIGIVLKRDDPLHRTCVRVEQRDAVFEHTR